ncbi:MAG: SpoIIE family protein phosphatase, partial [Mycobacteriaceae bacterium]|nr:SpoIIE family protein phosphatase [Mycobacteriaceae bacterium]
MTDASDFRYGYAAALTNYLAAQGEATLAVGHDLGRQALQDRISMLDIIENHFHLIEGLTKESDVDSAAALQFLLQTLAALDVATRGFLDGTRRYEHERARADNLANRDEFHSALVNSLQEGFFVADRDGAVVEINDAFADITGYQADELPYRWPHPWVIDRKTATEQMSRLTRDGNAQYETRIRHREGHTTWVAASINAVTSNGTAHDAYVGTIRDISAERAAAARETAVVRIATAVSVAKSVAEVLTLTLEEFRTAIDLRRVMAVIWSTGDGDPTIQVAGEPSQSHWREFDPFLRKIFENAHREIQLTVEPVGSPEDRAKSCGFVAALSGTGDVALWFEHSVPRRVTVEEKELLTALVGHLSLAIQHVRQFETARETSLTLQRAMLAPMEPPAGFSVRYEPAVEPLEIGGDWYDVLPVDDHRIGIIVGDCVGRGLSAAAVMGQLRSSARALLLTGAEPAMLLEQLDLAAALIPDAYCTTVFTGVLDTGSGTLRYSNAGHVPAVVATPVAGPALLSEA